MRFLISIVLLLTGCATTMSSLSDDYEIVQGIMVTEPYIEDGHKLFLYLQTEDLASGIPKITLVVAENRDNKKVLFNLSRKLCKPISETECKIVSPEPVFVYGKGVEGQWREYVKGATFEAKAIGYYDPIIKDYHIVLTTYGTGLREVLGSVSWGKFVGLVAKEAVKKGL